MTKPTIPTYETDEEIAAARAMYGDHYDRMIERKEITAPTRTDLPQSELEERLEAKLARREAATKGATTAAKKYRSRKRSTNHE
jgi:hypothetical protein